jgi:hypothetical protein
MRKGTLIGVITSLLGVLALFLNLVSFKVGEISDVGNTALTVQNLSVYSCLQNTLIGYEAQEAFQTIFNSFLILSISIALFSLLSNKKNFIGIITLILSCIHLTASIVLFNLGPQALKNIDNINNVSFGVGLYLLILSGILGVVASILSIFKK